MHSTGGITGTERRHTSSNLRGVFGIFTALAPANLQGIHDDCCVLNSQAPQSWQEILILYNYISTVSGAEVMKTFIASVLVLGGVTVASQAFCEESVILPSEWVTLTPPNGPNVFASFQHGDGGILIIMCDVKKKLISYSLVEPRAQWKADDSIKVTIRSDVWIAGLSDDGREMSPSTGVVLGPTQLMVGEESTWDVFVMGQAKDFFTMRVGSYQRDFPTANLRRAVAPVLHACGDGWDIEDAMDTMPSRWGPWPTAKDDLVAAGYKHDDGGALVVQCGTKIKLISIILQEPRASWQAGGRMNFMTRPDGIQIAPAKALVVDPTTLELKEDATRNLTAMGKATNYFAVGTGEYARIFPAADFRKSVEPVMEACGGHWLE
jgi:hypothetical protein